MPLDQIALRVAVITLNKGHDQRSKLGNNVDNGTGLNQVMTEVNEESHLGGLNNSSGQNGAKMQQGNSHHYSLEVPLGTAESQAQSGQSAQIVRPIKNNIIT